MSEQEVQKAREEILPLALVLGWDTIHEMTRTVFRAVRDRLQAAGEVFPECNAYRLAWEKPEYFYFSHTADDCISILIQEAQE